MIIPSVLNKRYAAKWKRLIWLLLAVQLLLPETFAVSDNT